MNSTRTPWEKEYAAATGHITAPETLDQKVFAHARSYKPIKTESRTLSKAATGCSAIAIAILLLHPAQYLGALTPNPIGSSQGSEDPRLKYRPKPAATQTQSDQWFNLRSEVKAGNYVSLCNHWRQQERASNSDKLPADLESQARQHCRILPVRP